MNIRIGLLAVGALMLLLTSWCLALLLVGRRFPPVESGATVVAGQCPGSLKGFDCGGLDH